MTGSPSIVFCAPAAARPEPWIGELSSLMPDARIEVWSEDARAADYAIVWTPPDAFYASQPKLKAVFNLGAGVDGLLRSTALPAGLPLIRLEDAGMAPLMVEYVLHAVLRHVRAFDRMETDRRERRWAPRWPSDRALHPIGIMGSGALGRPVAEALVAHGFPVSLWSRSVKEVDGARSYPGLETLPAFLAATRVLVCLLPLTAETEDIIDRQALDRLMPDAYVINVARGRHLVADDLLDAIRDGKVAGATLDVFREEPLPSAHPFWDEPRITITPHCSAMTQRSATLRQIADKIARLERDEPVSGIVDRQRGY